MPPLRLHQALCINAAITGGAYRRIEISTCAAGTAIPAVRFPHFNLHFRTSGSEAIGCKTPPLSAFSNRRLSANKKCQALFVTAFVYDLHQNSPFFCKFLMTYAVNPQSVIETIIPFKNLLSICFFTAFSYRHN